MVLKPTINTGVIRQESVRRVHPMSPAVYTPTEARAWRQAGWHGMTDVISYRLNGVFLKFIY